MSCESTTQTKRLALTFAAVFSSLCVLAGCETIQDSIQMREVEQERQARLEEIDVAACEEAGGSVVGVCMFGMPACVLPYSDAGKVCTDGSECEGMCVVDETNLGPNNRPEVGSAATGVCIADDNPCGCWFEISNGEIQHGLCAD